MKVYCSDCKWYVKNVQPIKEDPDFDIVKKVKKGKAFYCTHPKNRHSVVTENWEKRTVLRGVFGDCSELNEDNADNVDHQLVTAMSLFAQILVEIRDELGKESRVRKIGGPW